MQAQYFAVHHHVDRAIQIKINSTDSAPRRQGMIDVGSVVEGRQIAN